jgi:hypothetical protein
VKVASFSCDNLIPIAPGPTVLESFIISIANSIVQQEINSGAVKFTRSGIENILIPVRNRMVKQTL